MALLKEWRAMRVNRKDDTFFASAVASGALTVSKSGAKRLNIKRLVTSVDGKDRLRKISTEIKSLSRTAR